MFEDLNIKYLFPEFFTEYIRIYNDYALIYPLSIKNFYFFVENMINIMKSENDKSKDYFMFIVERYKDIGKILSEIYNNPEIINYDEDNILTLFMATLHINTGTIPIDERTRERKIDTKNNVGELLKAFYSLSRLINDIIIHLTKLNFNPEHFGNIDGFPIRMCKLTNLTCNLCNKFDFDVGDCNYSYYSCKYLTVGGALILTKILTLSKIEDKDFLYKILTGESLVEKVVYENIKGKSIDREESILNEAEKDFIYNELREKIYTHIKRKYDFKFKNMGILSSFKEKIENNTFTLEDLDINTLIKYIIEIDGILCNGIKYILFIREGGLKFDFPYDCNFSNRLVNENYDYTKKAFGENIDDNLRLSHPKIWDEERYNLYYEGVNTNNIVNMRIAYEDWLYNWYYFIIKKKYNIDNLNIYDLLLKYIFDKIVKYYSIAYSYDMVIFNSKREVKKMVSKLQEFIRCVKDLPYSSTMKEYIKDIKNNPLWAEPKFYIFDKERYINDNKGEKSISISIADIIKNFNIYNKYIKRINIEEVL